MASASGTSRAETSFQTALLAGREGTDRRTTEGPPYRAKARVQYLMIWLEPRKEIEKCLD
jgi:hypothetical protein